MEELVRGRVVDVVRVLAGVVLGPNEAGGRRAGAHEREAHGPAHAGPEPEQDEDRHGDEGDDAAQVHVEPARVRLVQVVVHGAERGGDEDGTEAVHAMREGHKGGYSAS